jgi:hypothetical protein
MTVDVWPVESGDGKFFIRVTIDGTAMEPRGPFSSVDEAGSMARRLLQLGRTLSGGGNRG